MQKAQVCMRLEKLQVLQELASVPKDGEVGSARLATLLPALSHARVGTDDVVYSEGEPSDACYIVVSGGVELLRSNGQSWRVITRAVFV